MPGIKNLQGPLHPDTVLNFLPACLDVLFEAHTGAVSKTDSVFTRLVLAVEL